MEVCVSTSRIVIALAHPNKSFFCMAAHISKRTMEFVQFLADVEFFENKLWSEHEKMYNDCDFETAMEEMRKAVQYLIDVSVMEDAHTAYQQQKGA